MNITPCASVVLSLFLSIGRPLFATGESTDVLVFGATPAGIAASIAAAKDGCQVILVEPTHRIGGMVTSGLSHSDFRTREGLTGAFLDFAQRVESYYKHAYGEDSPQVRDSFGGVFAEPKVALHVFQEMLAEFSGIQVVTRRQLVGVESTSPTDPRSPHGRAISSVTLKGESGPNQVIRARIVIDASYEGDLMATAGVPWRVGREAKHEFQEPLAPDVTDDQLQAYNFRFTMTREPANRVTPVAPPGYRRDDFLGVLDALQSKQISRVFDYPTGCIFKAQTPPLPNGKYDINDVSRGLVRLSLPGKNAGWPNGTDHERRQIFSEHLRDQVGLLYFLQNDESVPASFRDEASQWGWCRDEYIETNHLPPQLYVREARRMIGTYVYSQHDSEHAPNDARAMLHLDSIAAGDYGNNCHGTQHEGARFAGRHTGEFYNPVPPYQIPYGVLVPRDWNNVLVPTAVSATHVGFCALRLEPIWMSLGQAAGHAAVQAVRRQVAVQGLAIAPLQHRLHRDGAATIYVSDIPRSDRDFIAVQWWGARGGWHGLAPMPEKPGPRGRNLHGQYYEASPGQKADLPIILDDKIGRRWTALALLSGIPADEIPPVTPQLTRGEFVRTVFEAAQRNGLTESLHPIPRLHASALANHHPPGEVDNVALVKLARPNSDSLPGIVVDECDAELIGQWQYSTHTPPYVGRGYIHDLKEGKGQKSATFTPDIPRKGIYEVRVSHCYNVRRATNALVTVKYADGQIDFRIDQQHVPEHEGLFRTIGRFTFGAGRSGWVRISNHDTDGKYVIVDAVQFLPVADR